MSNSGFRKIITIPSVPIVKTEWKECTPNFPIENLNPGFPFLPGMGSASEIPESPLFLALFSLFTGEKSSFLHFKKGDLIVLEESTGREVQNNGWCHGYCERTRQHGDFPSENVYVLPTLEKPQKDVLVCCWLFIYIMYQLCELRESRGQVLKYQNKLVTPNLTL